MTEPSPGFAPFVLGADCAEEEPATQPALAPADTHAQAEVLAAEHEAMPLAAAAELPRDVAIVKSPIVKSPIVESPIVEFAIVEFADTPPTPPDHIIHRDRLAVSVERYGQLLDEHAATLAAGLQPSDAVMRRLVGMLDQARAALAGLSKIPCAGNADALAKAVRRGLSEAQQPRHDDLMRLVERARRLRPRP